MGFALLGHVVADVKSSHNVNSNPYSLLNYKNYTDVNVAMEIQIPTFEEKHDKKKSTKSVTKDFVTKDEGYIITTEDENVTLHLVDTCIKV